MKSSKLFQKKKASKNLTSVLNYCIILHLHLFYTSVPKFMTTQYMIPEKSSMTDRKKDIIIENYRKLVPYLEN